AVAREAEARGYHTAWTGEVSGYDAISVMTLIASHTERIHVGSAVLPVQTRTPVVLGMSAASLNHFAPGRVGLGLGLSSKTIVADWHGLAFSPSLQQIREAVRIIRLVAAGERVSVEGAFVRTCVTDDVAAARETLAREITGYAAVDAYASFFRSVGFEDEVAAVNAAWRAGDRAGAVRQVSPRFLDGLGVVGPEAHCRERIAAFARAGLTQPVILPFAPAAGAGGDARAALFRTLRTFP